MTSIPWMVWTEAPIGEIRARDRDVGWVRALEVFPGATSITPGGKATYYTVYGAQLVGEVVAPTMMAAMATAMATWGRVLRVQSKAAYEESLAADHVLAKRHPMEEL